MKFLLAEDEESFKKEGEGETNKKKSAVNQIEFEIKNEQSCSMQMSVFCDKTNGRINE